MLIASRLDLLLPLISRDSKCLVMDSARFVMRTQIATLKMTISLDMEILNSNVPSISTLQMEKQNVIEKYQMKVVLLDTWKKFYFQTLTISQNTIKSNQELVFKLAPQLTRSSTRFKT